ncbi:MAG: Flp family type IVb pilin [Pirellulaceae bacterium]|nr:Flp family type IVb pilin [Pirellulaceae bacterium]
MSIVHWRAKLKRVMLSEDGPTAVEYAVMLALIVIACVGAVKNLATATGSSFDRSSAAINQAMGG